MHSTAALVAMLISWLPALHTKRHPQDPSSYQKEAMCCCWTRTTYTMWCAIFEHWKVQHYAAAAAATVQFCWALDVACCCHRRSPQICNPFRHVYELASHSDATVQSYTAQMTKSSKYLVAAVFCMQCMGHSCSRSSFARHESSAHMPRHSPCHALTTSHRQLWTVSGFLKETNTQWTAQAGGRLFFCKIECQPYYSLNHMVNRLLPRPQPISS